MAGSCLATLTASVSVTVPSLTAATKAGVALLTTDLAIDGGGGDVEKFCGMINGCQNVS
jgi:hypothetical protein